MIGIPFFNSEDFMRVISTTRTVQIELSGERRKIANDVAIPYRVTAICFEDTLLKIRAVKPNGHPQIERTSSNIEQVLAGAAV